MRASAVAGLIRCRGKEESWNGERAAECGVVVVVIPDNSTRYSLQPGLLRADADVISALHSPDPVCVPMRVVPRYFAVHLFAPTLVLLQASGRQTDLVNFRRSFEAHLHKLE